MNPLCVLVRKNGNASYFSATVFFRLLPILLYAPFIHTVDCLLYWLLYYCFLQMFMCKDQIVSCTLFFIFKQVVHLLGQKR